jgi:hypothetical protein
MSAAHVGVLCVCAGTAYAGWLELRFFNNKSTTCFILAAAVSVPHIFRPDKYL